MSPMTVVNVSEHEFLVETNDGTGASETGQAWGAGHLAAGGGW